MALTMAENVLEIVEIKMEDFLLQIISSLS